MPRGKYKRKSSQGFQKGHKSFRKNYNVSEETRRKLSESHKGYKMPEEQKRKIGESSKKSQNKGKFKKGKIPWNKGVRGKFKHSEITKNKIGLKMKKIQDEKVKLGTHNWWLGGKSFEAYGLDFNEDLKEVIRNRDRRKCQLCDKTELDNKERLNVHHVDYDKKNNNPNNLLSLCISCHAKTNQKREYWLKYFKGREKK